MKPTLKEIGKGFHIISLNTESRYNQSRYTWSRLFIYRIHGECQTKFWIMDLNLIHIDH